MLPVVAGKAETRRQIYIYSMLLVAISLAPVVLGFAGAGYGLAAAVMGGKFLHLAFRVKQGRCDQAARRMFYFSILYLFVLFLALIVEHLSAMAFAHLA